MLSYPDRHKFEQLRSRWEAAQTLTHIAQPRMVGRREKPAVAGNSEDATNASKFRRKLSNGLSFISLSQRKVTPLRPSLPVTDLTTAANVPSPHPHDTTRLLSPMGNLSRYGPSSVRKVASNNTREFEASVDPDATPKQLPRSRTMSFIPRPSRSGSESSVASNLAPSPQPPAYSSVQEPRAMPTKLPSPDPNNQARRRTSARQYHPALTSQQAKHAAAGDAFAKAKSRSTSKASPQRSHTTPNLLKGMHSSSQVSFMSPRCSTQQKSSSIPAPPKPAMKENSTPNTQQQSKRLSNIQEQPPSSQRRDTARRGGLMAPTVASKRRSTGPTNAWAQSKQTTRTTPTTCGKHQTSLVLHQTPLAAQRAVHKKCSPLRTTDSLHASSVSTVTQNRLLGAVSPIASRTNGHAPSQDFVPRANTDKDLRKRTFSTPYKKFGGSGSGRGHAGVKNEVRLPRSSTYHHFKATPEDPPPLPAVPEHYKSVSMPLLAQPTGPARYTLESVLELEMGDSDDEKSSIRSGGSGIVAFLTKQRNTERHPSYAKHTRHASLGSQIHRPRKSSLPQSKSMLSIRIPGPVRSFSASLLLSAKSSESRSAKTPKSWDDADLSVDPQVKEYMPALYWAGRFQSRYDQWRTEAMHVELDPDYCMEGSLSHCNVHQEKVAACHIFLQLRDLCFSHQAADSLWVSW